MESRTKNTKRNIIASYLLMIMQMVFQFVSRAVIVHTLGEQYLGLSSLFTSVLNVLNIAESGFSVSIIYFMYKPIADGDTDRVCALLSYLRKVYKIVGLVILTVGLIITPFIPFIIKDNVPQSINVYVLYILYLINTSISYFLFAYKTSLLTALQRLDLTKIANCIVILAQYILQILALVILHNYYVFLIVMIVGTASVNLFAAYISKRKYPQYYCHGELQKSEKHEIISKVKGLLICNISAVTFTSLDSIILSAYLGLTSVAVYNNYIVVFNAITTAVILIRQSMQAGVGDSVAVETVEKNYQDLLLWQFLFSIIGTWCATCIVCLYQPFMKIWMGEQMLLPMSDVYLLGAWLMVTISQHAYFLYLTGAGLWNEMKAPYIFSTLFNLLMNILLGKMIGTTGIILASLLSCLIAGVFWQCPIILKCYFRKSAKKYILHQLLYFLFAGVVVVITYVLANIFVTSGWTELFVKACVCIVVPTLIIFLVSLKTPYYKRAKSILLHVFRK